MTSGNRRVIVTGGSAGIGLAVALRLAQRGDNIFVCGRSPNRLEEALAAIVAQGRPGAKIGGAVCDVRDFAAVSLMVEEAKLCLGGIDGLVNSAGVTYVEELGDLTPDQWAEMIGTNLSGVFNCCHAALPHLKDAANSGSVVDIVNLGSRSGRYAFRGGVGYNATKFGLQGMTEAMFLDVNRFGIRVGLIAPGTVATGFGGAPNAEWHLGAEDVAFAVESMINAEARACVNWIELRPARPPA